MPLSTRAGGGRSRSRHRPARSDRRRSVLPCDLPCGRPLRPPGRPRRPARWRERPGTAGCCRQRAARPGRRRRSRSASHGGSGPAPRRPVARRRRGRSKVARSASRRDDRRPRRAGRTAPGDPARRASQCGAVPAAPRSRWGPAAGTGPTSGWCCRRTCAGGTGPGRSSPGRRSCRDRAVAGRAGRSRRRRRASRCSGRCQPARGRS